MTSAAGWLGDLLFALSMALTVPAGVLLVQVLAARRSARTDGIGVGMEPRMTILVPAHDESELITDTVRSLLRELAVGDRLLVVADNCSDDTAARARAAGAEVVQRNDASRRGKGFALDHGVRHLTDDPPEAVVVVDADCEVSRGRLRALAAVAVASGRPAQAAYAMLAPPAPTLPQRIAAFAWVVKTMVRPSGMKTLGLPCQLLGSGMAFPWPLVARLPLASAALAEDVELGVAAARAGTPPRFEPMVEITSRFPTERASSLTQRRRWEQGSLAAARRFVGPLLLDGLRHRDAALLAMALDLAVPPLALLCLLVAGAAVMASGATYVAGAATAVVYLSVLVPAVLLGAAVLVAWWRFGRECLSLAQLAYAPCYAIGKVGMYLSAALSRRPDWVRTKRR